MLESILSEPVVGRVDMIRWLRRVAEQVNGEAQGLDDPPAAIARLSMPPRYPICVPNCSRKATMSFPAATSIGSQTLIPDSIHSGISSSMLPSESMSMIGQPLSLISSTHLTYAGMRNLRTIAGEIMLCAL